MKRIISLILALTIIVVLCACGSKQEEDNSQVEGNSNDNVINDVSATTLDTQPPMVIDKIDLGELVLVDDANVKISLLEFYTNTLIAFGNSDGGKCATFKVENKTDREINVWVLPYLNNESLQAAFVDGSSTAVEAGRIGRMGFSFTYGSYPNCSDLESVEELYDMEFTFELSIGAGTSNFERHNVTASVATAINPDIEAEPSLERFSIRDDVHFGDSMDEVASKEQYLDIDYESAGKNGYIAAQAKTALRKPVDFEGIEEAYLFYNFDAQSMDLSQVYVMFGHGDDRLAMVNTYEHFLKVYFERYGIQLTDEQMQSLPIETIAYEYATTHYEDAQLEKHNRWLVQDAEGYVVIDVATSLIFGDSYYTFVGMRHVTEEEIVAAGGDMTMLLQE